MKKRRSSEKRLRDTMEEIVADEDSTLEYEPNYDEPNYGLYSMVSLVLSPILGLSGLFMFFQYIAPAFSDITMNIPANTPSMITLSLVLMGLSFLLFCTSMGLLFAYKNQRKRLGIRTEHSKLYGWLAVAVVVAAILWFCHGYGLF